MPIIKHNGNTYGGLGTNIEVDTSVIEGSTNAVSGGAVYKALQNIQVESGNIPSDITLSLSVDAWTLDETDNTYKQTIAVESSISEDPIIMLDSEKETEDELNAFACLLDKTVVEESNITFIASEKPSITFDVIVKGAIVSAEDIAELEIKVNTLEENLSINEKETTSILNTLAKVFGKYYELPVTITTADNYTIEKATAVLIGTTLRIYVNATRTTETSVGNIGNEYVVHLNVQHDGKIKNAFRSSTTTSSEGGVCTFLCSTTVADENNLTVEPLLCATTIATTNLSFYVNIPCTLNIENF